MKKQIKKVFDELCGTTSRSKIMLLLEECPEVINAVDEGGNTILLATPSWKVVETLINWGADVNIRNAEGMTALHYWVMNDHEDTVELLVDAGADLDAQDAEGRTPTMYSFLNKASGSAEYLVEHGADVNIQDNKGRTALHYAVLYRDYNFAKLLLRRGALVEVYDEYGFSPHTIAGTLTDTRMIRLLEQCSLVATKVGT